ncbi:MAG TPA: pyrimidine reductase family protein [Jiangellaceae bacterium]|nr:pyrimidine reductase family protein [Jiangellaceae bacterium]
MQKIYPAQEHIRGIHQLVAAYAYPTDGSPYVRANMVATLDGAAWGPNHRSGTISSAPDREVFAVLRALADVILVGAETARRERYGPAVTGSEFAGHRAALGQRPDPVIAVVSRSLDFDPAAPLFAAAADRTIVLTTESAPQQRRDVLSELVTVIIAGATAVDFGAALSALAGQGLTRVLCEGGPHLLGEIARAGLLDELCLTITPQLAGGDAVRILAGGQALRDVELALAHILEQDGTLLTRWTVQPAPSTSARS